MLGKNRYTQTKQLVHNINKIPNINQYDSKYESPPLDPSHQPCPLQQLLHLKYLSENVFNACII